ncbi:unnamed protein product [Microthlaspi erraticum]|uniref:Tf2-1-like SH3-like domain-containing protein n=1 Tax=Microthlaspi erraticum TaxID=1685480 RepID=A0A6D2HZQ7_9BRAS|nr:unnamed protein product [Microthlaspi erraticum]CAA7044472.1 unnamed protein product [Microthlaspi erraticum]
MKEAQDRQKSYADRRRRELEFQVGDRVYLKMAMLRGPNRSIPGNKLSPCFMGPFPVVERVGPLAYRLELPEIMKAFHKVFHVSMLRKCLHPTEELVARIPEDVQPDLTVPAVPVRMLCEDLQYCGLARSGFCGLCDVVLGFEVESSLVEESCNIRSPFLEFWGLRRATQGVRRSTQQLQNQTRFDLSEIGSGLARLRAGNPDFRV